MRILFSFVLATASGAALAQDQLDLCAEDVDCKGALICVQQKCVLPPEPPKPAPSVVPQPVSRVEVSLALGAGVSTLEQNNVVASDLYYGGALTAAYSLAPALAVVTAVDLRYVHPSDANLFRYLSLSGGLRFQTRSRVFAVDALVGWSQFFIYQSVNGVSQNGAIDGTLLSLLGHIRILGPVELQVRLGENLFSGIKTREFGVGLGVRL
jgi:hypothetical protein